LKQVYTVMHGQKNIKPIFMYIQGKRKCAWGFL